MDKENEYRCLFCNAIFSGKGSLKTHEDSIHKNIKFDCKDCGKQYKVKGILTKHINIVHKGLKYKCDQCDCKLPPQDRGVGKIRDAKTEQTMTKIRDAKTEQTMTSQECLRMRAQNQSKGDSKVLFLIF